MNHILFLFFSVGPPKQKRLKYAVEKNAKPASCKAPSDEIKQKSSFGFCESVPVYYHWFSVALQDKLLNKDSDSIFNKYIDNLSKLKLDILVNQLLTYKTEQNNCNNEYKCASLFHSALNSFLFDYEQIERAACLSQYPVFGTRRTDWSVYSLKDYLPWLALLHSDYKPHNFGDATKETMCYFTSENQDRKDAFTWALGLPCTSTKMGLQLYMSGHATTLCIDLYEVEINDTNEFRFFLTVLYAAIQWLMDNPQLPRKSTFACEPIMGLVLRNNFEDHPSKRVFYDECKERVYKFYCCDNHKQHNFAVMQQMGYFEDLTLQPIGKRHHLLSYKYIPGRIIPIYRKHIDMARECLHNLHALNFVHADIRIGNIVFCRDRAYLIDFDFAAPPGSPYHSEYNFGLSERKRNIKLSRKSFDHDTYSLTWIGDNYVN